MTTPEAQMHIEMVRSRSSMWRSEEESAAVAAGAVLGGGEAEDVARAEAAHREVHHGRGHVVALVDDDVAADRRALRVRDRVLALAAA